MAVYIPLVYKKNIDFKRSLKLVEKKNLKSICSFRDVETHPMTCCYLFK